MGFVAGSSAKALVVRRMEELAEQNREIENRIRELEELTSANGLSDSEFDLLRQMLSVFRTSVDEMSVEEKRAAIRAVVRRVVWDGGMAHVVLFGADEGEIEFPDSLGSADEATKAPKSPWGEDSK